MKKDKLLNLIHAIGEGKPLGYCNSVSTIADECGCSRSYAIRWLNHFCNSGYLSRVRVAYKNTVKDYFCATSNLENTMQFLEGYMLCTVLEVQENGDWIQCLTTLPVDSI